MLRRPDQTGPTAPGAGMRGLGAVARLGAFAWMGAWATALTGALATIAWGAGALLGDRYPWSQHASWIPAGHAALVALALGLLSYALGRLSRGAAGLAPAAVSTRRRRSVAGRTPRRLAIVLGVVSGIVAVGEWRLYRVPLPEPADPGTPALRVLFINAASEDVAGALPAIAEASPDVVLVSNPRLGRGAAAFHRALVEAVGIPPEDTAGRLRSVGRTLVVSRSAMTDAGSTSLGLGRASQTRTGQGRTSDNGRAAYVTLDWPPADAGAPESPAVGASAPTLWIIDLPRDPWRHRPPMTGAARDAIDAWRHPRTRLATRTDDQGRTIAVLGDLPGTEAAEDDGPTGFPEPALIVGDFNTPRGAGALRALVGHDANNAHAQAGVGASLTFPRERAWLAIDLAYTLPGWRAARHRVIDLGAGTHRAVVVDLVPEG